MIEEWREPPACINVDPEIFFFDIDYPLAIQVCKECPVIDQCRSYSDVVEFGAMLHGIWAGETPDERMKRRRNKRKLVALCHIKRRMVNIIGVEKVTLVNKLLLFISQR